MKYRSITVSGLVATGTTTAAKTLCTKYNLEFHSAGEFFRKYMDEHNIPLYDHAKVPDDLDKQIDDDLIALAESEKGVLIDGRYIGYLTRDMDHVLHVLFVCDETERIQRALERGGKQETPEEIIKRDEENDTKFRKLYADENFLDPKFFNLTVDTTLTQPEDVVRVISKEFERV